MDLAGKAALVTGGAVRIGRAICETLAAEGCRVAIHFNRSRLQAEALAESLGGHGQTAFLVQGNISSEQDCKEVMGRAWEATGGLDILVNNASVYWRDALVECDEEAVMGQLRPNLLAPIFLTRALARRVKATGSIGAPSAAVVNILDCRITGNEAGCLPYLLSKKALADFTRIAALELAPDVAVNAVAPGAILPPTGEGQDGAFADKADGNPLRRRCTPEDVARAVVFLLQHDAVTGQIVFVDGGEHLV